MVDRLQAIAKRQGSDDENRQPHHMTHTWGLVLGCDGVGPDLLQWSGQLCQYQT